MQRRSIWASRSAHPAQYLHIWKTTARLRLSARPTSHSRILPGELLRKTALEVKVFFLDARFEVFSLTVNFAIPFLLLVAEGVTAMNSHMPLDAQKIAVRAATLMTYVSITTALNLIVNWLISLRESGYRRHHQE